MIHSAVEKYAPVPGNLVGVMQGVVNRFSLFSHFGVLFILLCSNQLLAQPGISHPGSYSIQQSTNRLYKTAGTGTP